MPKFAGELPRERQSIAFRHGQLDALRQIAKQEGHANVSLVIQILTDAEIKRRGITIPTVSENSDQKEAA